MDKINIDDLLLLWAHSEAFSGRWNEKFKCDFNLTDYYTVIETKDPNTLKPELKQKLIDWLVKSRKKLLDKYIYSSKTFEIIDYPSEKLEKFIIMPEMMWVDTPITLGDFMGMPHDEDILTDPRVNAKIMAETVKDNSNYVGYPVIAYDEKLKTDVLVEGYTRCMFLIEKLKVTNNHGPIKMIHCAR